MAIGTLVTDLHKCFNRQQKPLLKNGIISIIGVYSDQLRFFPIGKVFSKNITIKTGDCNHHKYIPMLLEWVKSGQFDSRNFITHKLSLNDIEEAYKTLINVMIIGLK